MAAPALEALAKWKGPATARMLRKVAGQQLLGKQSKTSDRPVATRPIEYEHEIVARTCRTARPACWDVELPVVPVCVRISWLIPGPPVFVVNAMSSCCQAISTVSSHASAAVTILA